MSNRQTRWGHIAVGLISYALISSVVFDGCASKPQRNEIPAQTIAACEFLKSDLESLNDTIKQDFSGYEASSETKALADRAYRQAVNEVPRCRNSVDYIRTIRAYFAKFTDPHLQSTWTIGKYAPMFELSTGKQISDFKQLLEYSATGLFVQKYNEQYFITGIDTQIFPNKGISFGDEVTECDGMSVESILEEKILPYETVSAESAARYRLAPKLFFRWDMPAEFESKCKFRRGGKEFQEKLRWTKASPDYLSRFDAARPTYSSAAKPYGHWVAVSSFAGYSKQVIADLLRFEGDAEKFSKDRVVVLDLRYNTGGDSSYGVRWLQALYGYEALSDDKAGKTLFRSSPANIAHLIRLTEAQASSGKEVSESERYEFQEYLRCLEVGKGALVDCTKNTPSRHTKSKQKELPKFKGKLVVLTDSACFSSCELVLEAAKGYPNVVHVGLETDASTPYGDIRLVMAPSGLFFYKVPTKVFPIQRSYGRGIIPDFALKYDPETEIAGGDSLMHAVDDLIRLNRLPSNR